jgi:hypothetical protein
VANEDLTLGQRLAEEFATGQADLSDAPQVAAIPTPAEDVSSLYKAVRAIKSVLDTMTGTSGSVLDKSLTARDLINEGAFTYIPSQGIVGGATTVNVTGGSTGGGGEEYVDPRPVLDVPPTPTNLVAVGAFKTIILTWDLFNYRNHAYTEIWRGTVDNLSLAVLINTEEATIYTDASGTFGVTYYYWVRAVTDQGVAGAFNASAGTPAGLGQIGTADLGPLIVEAGNLASGAVTASKIATGALDATKFASSIEPVTIVIGSVVPLVKSTNTIYLTGTGKLYRWDGAAYVLSVSATDIVGQLVAGQISAGAIGATQIAANAISTRNLLVTNQGASLFPDPTFEDQASWGVTYGGTLTEFKTVTDAPAGRYVAFAPNAGIGYSVAWFPGGGVRCIPIDRAKQYRLTFWYRAPGAPSGSNFYATVQERDSTGALIGGNGGHNFYLHNIASVPATWTKIEALVGAGTATPFSATTRFVSPSFLFNWESGGGEVQIADVRFAERVDATLIVDGSIIASKIAANAIAVGTAAIQNGAIVNAMIGNLAVDTAKIADGAITTAKIGSLQVTNANIANATIDSTKILDATISTAKIGDGQITNAKIANATITDAKIVSVTANQITTGSLTGQTITGGVIQTAASDQPKRIVLNEDGTSNEARFYGSRGDGVTDLLASVGLKTVGGDTVIGYFGHSHSSNTKVGVQGISYSNLGVNGQSTTYYGVLGTSTSSTGVRGISTSGSGVYGFSSTGSGTTGSTASNVAAPGAAGVMGETTGAAPAVLGYAGSGSGYGGYFQGNVTKAPLFLAPVAGASKPSDRTAGALAVLLISGQYYLAISDGTNWRSVNGYNIL